MWTGLMLGTALAILAMTDGVRLKVGHVPPFLGWILGGLLTWLLVVGAATVAAELLRRHHRALGRHAGRGLGHGWRLARRHGGRGLAAATQAADRRWQARQAGPRPGPAREPIDLGAALNPARWLAARGQSEDPGPFTDPNPTPPDGIPAVPAARPAATPGGWGEPDPAGEYGTGPWLLAVRRKDGQPYYDGPGGSRLGTAVVDDPGDLRRRLEAAAGDSGTEVRVAPVKASDSPGSTAVLDPAVEADIKRQACDLNAANGLMPEEVVVGADGSVTLDRRRHPDGRYPQARPIEGEIRWSPFRGAARVYAIHPSGPATPHPDPVPTDVEQAIKQGICGLPWAAAEGMQPGDVTVGPYGAITIDRSRTHPGQTAYDGLRWVPLPDGSVAVTAAWRDDGAATPAGGAVPPADATGNHHHGGTDMPTGTTADQPVDYWPNYSGPRPANLQRRTARTAAAPEPNGVWKQVISSTHGFEPENDSHLLGWMAGEAGGMSGYAEEIADVYETAVNTIGLDPVAMAALHDYADAAATAAEAMAKARQRFADHYAEVRAFAASGGVLPYNGRWMTGEGD
jgi:hypothetical protein